MRRIAGPLGAALLVLASAAGANTPDNRAIVADFVKRFYDERDVAGAFAAHVSPGYVQHNPGLPDGPKAAVDMLAPMFAAPGSRFEVKHLLVDGDLAAVHYRSRLSADDRGAAVVEIFRFEKGRIVERWDMCQQMPEKSLNDHPLF